MTIVFNFSGNIYAIQVTLTIALNVFSKRRLMFGLLLSVLYTEKWNVKKADKSEPPELAMERLLLSCSNCSALWFLEQIKRKETNNTMLKSEEYWKMKHNPE